MSGTCFSEGSREIDSILFKFVNSRYAVGFDEGATTALTCELVAAGCDVVVALAVRSGSELFKELQIGKSSGIDGCCFLLLARNS